MNKSYGAVLNDRGSAFVVEGLESLAILRRSSKYGFRRHSIINGEAYERALRLPQPGNSLESAGRARILRMLGRKEEALQEFKRALELDRFNAAAYAWRWELCLGAPSKNRDHSFGDIDKAIGLEPGNPLWRVLKAFGELARHNPVAKIDCRNALKHIDAALSLDSDFILAHIAAAIAFENMELIEKALKNIDSAVRIDSRQGWLYHYRGMQRLKLGDHTGFAADCESAALRDEGAGYFKQILNEPSTALRDLAKAADGFLESHKNAYWMYVFRGDCRRSPEVNNFSGALADFETAVSLKPDCSLGWAFLSRARMTGGNSQLALDAIDRAIEISPDCGWFNVWRGEIRRRLRDFHGALPDFNQGLALDPDYEFGYAWRGGANRQIGKPALAIPDLDLAFKLEPNYAWTIHERSLALRALGRIGPALKDLETACRMDPKFSWCSRPESFSEGLNELDEELLLHPDNAWAYAWRGDIKIRMRDYRGARDDLRAALRLNPNLAWAHAWLGRALDSLGNPREAFREFGKAIRLDPGYANSFAWRGRLRHLSKRFRGALADLAEAAKRDNKSAWILAWKGETEMSLKNWKTAVDDLSRAIELDRNNFDALLARAQTRRKLSDIPGAKADVEAALALRPADGRANFLRGCIYKDLGTWSVARSDFEKALKGSGLKSAEISMARRFLAGGKAVSGAELEEAAVLGRNGRHADAAKLCTEILRRHPRYEEAFRQRSEAWRCMGEYERLVADLNQIVKLRKGDSKSLINRGVGRRTAFDFKGALRDGSAALRKKRVEAFAAQVLRSEALRNMGRFKESIEAASLSLKLNPTYAWTYVVRAKAKRQSGLLREALADTVKAAELNPKDAKAMAWQGDILRKMGLLRRAVKSLEKAVFLEPTCAWALALRGETYRELGDTKKGFEDISRAVKMDGNCSCAYDILGDDPEPVRQDSKYAWVFAWRGGIHRRLERWAEARKDLDRAVKLDEHCFWARAWRGELKLTQGDLKGALLDLDRAVSDFPGYVDGHVWRGKALCAAGIHEKAKSSFERALVLDPTHVWGLVGSGMCLEHLGHREAAKGCLERARAIAPGLFKAS